MNRIVKTNKGTYEMIEAKKAPYYYGSPYKYVAMKICKGIYEPTKFTARTLSGLKAIIETNDR